MIETPLTYDKPQRRRDRAESHFCEEVGSRLFCSKLDCPHCGIELDDPEGVDDETLRESIQEVEIDE